MKRSHALAHLRQLSCLGLGGEIVIPQMLETLMELIPANFSCFYWTDRNGRPTNMYATEIAPSTIDLTVNHYHLMQRPGEISVEILARGSRPIGNLDAWYAERRRLERTIAFNEIFLPEKSTLVLDAVVRSGNLPRGLILLGRGARDRGFSSAERRLLAEVVPWFLHALQEAPPLPAESFVAGGDRMVLLCDESGRLLACEPGAAQLLLQVAAPRIAPGALQGRAPQTLSPALRRLCARARAVHAGRPAGPPMARTANCWGTFAFHAHALESAGDPDMGGLVALTICREEHREIRLLNRLKSMPLAPRQRELARHLGLGRPAEEIRSRMGISNATYRAYVERVYQRLGVHSRAELAMSLDA